MSTESSTDMENGTDQSENHATNAAKGTTEADTWIELAKLSQESFFNRRSYEWKVAFGLWAAIGLVTYFGATNAEKFKDAIWLYVCLFLFTSSSAVSGYYCGRFRCAEPSS